MKKWRDIYNEVSYRTRWASIGFAGLLWLVLLLSLISLVHFVIIAESDLSRIVVANLDQLFLVGSFALISCRLFALLRSRTNGLRMARLSWNSLLILFFAFNIYFYLDSAGYFKPVFECNPIGTDICFGVYDMTRAPLWPLATLTFFLIGFAGIVAKSIYATFAYIRTRSILSEVDHV